jgi:hypothetical protein
MVLTSTVSNDGVLRLSIALGIEEANKDVRVTVEPMTPAPMSQEEWQRFITSTAGKSQGDFERPEQGELQERDPL